MRTIDWFEIPVAEMSRARKFYETVLGIEFKEENHPPECEMCIFPYSEPNTGGALCRMEHLVPGASGTLIYLNAGEDLSAPLARVEAAGGSILMAKTLLSPEIGAIAVFRDSEGNHIGLHSIR